MRSWLNGFILSAVSTVLAGAVAMVVALVATIASMLIYRLLYGHVPAIPEFFGGFIFATVLWPLDKRFERWLRTSPSTGAER